MARKVKDKLFNEAIEKIEYYQSILEEYKAQGLTGFINAGAIVMERRRIKKLIRKLKESDHC